MKKDVIIIGAGLTGLTTAFLLKKQGKEVLVVEKSDHTGGSIKTYTEKGYVYESGPNTGTLSNPEIVELFEMLNGKCVLEIANKDAHRRLIWKSGHLRALPHGFFSGLLTPLFSWKDKFGILLEPFREKGNKRYESVADLAVRRLGYSIFNYAVDPFISGIYAGDPYQLTTRYALPKLYNLEQTYGSFIYGAIRKKMQSVPDRDKKATREVFSVEGGLENLIKALVQEIGDENIVCGENNVYVSGEAENWTVTLKDKNIEYQTAKVISTIGPYGLKDIFPFVPEKLLDTINNLRYAKVMQVAVGVKVDPGMDLDAFGVLLPGVENRSILGVLYPSSCFPGRAPGGRVLFSVFLGGMRRSGLLTLPDAEIEELVKRELKVVFNKHDIIFDFIRIFRHLRAIPQYEANTGERIRAIEVFQNRYPGIILGGNMHGGVGIADRVKQAFSMSEV